MSKAISLLKLALNKLKRVDRLLAKVERAVAVNRMENLTQRCPYCDQTLLHLPYHLSCLSCGWVVQKTTTKFSSRSIQTQDTKEVTEGE